MSEVHDNRNSETAAHALVTAAFRALLLREPDPSGLASWSAELVSGRVDLEDMLKRILLSEEFAQRSAAILGHYVPSGDGRFTRDVSQFGETWLLVRKMINTAARHRIVVDVGARGRSRSNSYDLMRHFGWRGVLIEANPLLIPTISAEFATLDVTVIHAAVSDYVGEATFYIGINDDVSSLDQHAAAGWGSIRDQVTVGVQRLGTILQTHAIANDFDVLSIDAEGEDVKILNDVVASGFTPRWVIIEASFNFQTTSLAALPVTEAVASRYELAAQTPANLILRAIEPA